MKFLFVVKRSHHDSDYGGKFDVHEIEARDYDLAVVEFCSDMRTGWRSYETGDSNAVHLRHQIESVTVYCLDGAPKYDFTPHLDEWADNYLKRRVEDEREEARRQIAELKRKFDL